MLIQKLNDLKKLLLEEAGVVEKMLELTLAAMYKNEADWFDQVLAFEDKVNHFEIAIDNECTALIALNQPEAKDLRVILMIMRINNDLERLGDQVVNIAESVRFLDNNPILYKLPNLKAMGEETIVMLHDSINAFTEENPTLSQIVCEKDNIVDDFNNKNYDHIVQLMKLDPANIVPALDLLRISKNLERVADLSTNIAENTIYLVQGRVIKHHQED